MADPAQEPRSQGAISGRNGPSSSALARSHSLGPYLEARRQQALGAPCEGTTHHQGFHRPDLLVQSVCSHGHKLQFGDVQQAFNTGGPIKREQPLFVRMPPDGVPGESRDVRVQLLKTVNGLADGTREWRNCFLAKARVLGFETSVLEPCVLVLRSTQQAYHGIIGVAVDDIAGGGDDVWDEQSPI